MSPILSFNDFPIFVDRAWTTTSFSTTEFHFDLNYNLNFDHLRRLDDRVFTSDRLAAGGFVVVAAIVAIWVTVLGAEKVTASAPESGQPNLLPATRASVYGLLISLHRVDLPAANYDFGWWWPQIEGSRGSLQDRTGIYTGGDGCDGGVETFLTHVVGCWVCCDAAVIGAERRQGFEHFELRLFLLCSLRHLFWFPPPASYGSIWEAREREEVDKERGNRWNMGLKETRFQLLSSLSTTPTFRLLMVITQTPSPLSRNYRGLNIHFNDSRMAYDTIQRTIRFSFSYLFYFSYFLWVYSKLFIVVL